VKDEEREGRGGSGAAGLACVLVIGVEEGRGREERDRRGILSIKGSPVLSAGGPPIEEEDVNPGREVEEVV